MVTHLSYCERIMYNFGDSPLGDSPLILRKYNLLLEYTARLTPEFGCEAEEQSEGKMIKDDENIPFFLHLRRAVSSRVLRVRNFR